MFSRQVSYMVHPKGECLLIDWLTGDKVRTGRHSQQLPVFTRMLDKAWYLYQMIAKNMLCTCGVNNVILSESTQS